MCGAWDECVGHGLRLKRTRSHLHFHHSHPFGGIVLEPVALRAKDNDALRDHDPDPAGGNTKLLHPGLGDDDTHIRDGHGAAADGA